MLPALSSSVIRADRDPPGILREQSPEAPQESRGLAQLQVDEGGRWSSTWELGVTISHTYCCSRAGPWELSRSGLRTSRAPRTVQLTPFRGVPNPGKEPASSASPALQVDSSLLSHLGSPIRFPQTQNPYSTLEKPTDKPQIRNNLKYLSNALQNWHNEQKLSLV